MEHKYFDVIDDFRHPQCMMECSWWPKRNLCSLFRTKKDQTRLREFFIVISSERLPCRIAPFVLDVWLSNMSSEATSYVVWSIGISWTWQNKALQWTQIRSWKQQEVEVQWRDGGNPPRLVLAMKVHAPFFKPVLLAGVSNSILETLHSVCSDRLRLVPYQFHGQFLAFPVRSLSATYDEYRGLKEQ